MAALAQSRSVVLKLTPMLHYGPFYITLTNGNVIGRKVHMANAS